MNKFSWFNKNLTVKDRIELRRSRVRVVVTYLAALYAFVGAGGLMVALWRAPKSPETLSDIKDVFLTVLPVATGVITYWFATRRSQSDGEPSGQPDDGDVKSGQEDEDATNLTENDVEHDDSPARPSPGGTS